MAKRKLVKGGNKKNKITYLDKYKQKKEFKDGDYFEIEKILLRRGPDTNPEYFIKWQGWPDASNTWEPMNNLLNILPRVIEYEREKDPNKNLHFLNAFKYDDDDENQSVNSNDSIPSMVEGNLGKDNPGKIINIQRDKDEILLKVEWLIRKSDGVEPGSSWVKESDFRKKHLKMLLQFYEKLIGIII